MKEEEGVPFTIMVFNTKGWRKNADVLNNDLPNTLYNEGLCLLTLIPHFVQEGKQGKPNSPVIIAQHEAHTAAFVLPHGTLSTQLPTQIGNERER